MRKNKKNLKGMTLYEIIIAIAVFALMARVLVGVGMGIDKTTRATNNLKNKIVTEKPYAANKLTQDPSGNSIATSKEMTVRVSLDGTFHFKDNSGNDSSVTNPSIEMEADKFNTETAYTKDETQNIDVAGKEAEANKEYNGKLNLEFVQIRP